MALDADAALRIDDAPDVSPTPDAGPADTGPALRVLPPSSRALQDLVGFSLPGLDLPSGATPRDVGRRAWALRTVRALGLHRVRREILWAEVEPARGTFTWDGYDAIVSECAATGIDVLGLLAYGTPWASSAAGATAENPPDDPADFAAYVTATVNRYRAHVHDWEVWNEPNAGFRFWRPSLRGDPVAFGRLVASARSAVVAVDPAARVAFGGTVFLPQLIEGGVAFSRDSFDANPGLAASLGAFAMHAYTLYPPRVGPEAEGGGEVSHVHKIQQMAAMLGDEGFDTARPLWVTETGWPVTADVSELQQAQYLVRTVLLSAFAGADGVWLYELGDGPGGNALVPEDDFGLYHYDPDPADTQDPAPKPAAGAVAGLVRTLGGSHVVARETPAGQPDEGWVLRLEDAAGRRAWAVWRTDDGGRPWQWTPPGEAVDRFDMNGDALAGSGPLTPGTSPVYLRAR